MRAADQIARLFARREPELEPTELEPFKPSRCSACGDKLAPRLHALELPDRLALLCPECVGCVADYVTALELGFRERRCRVCACSGEACDAHRAAGSACCGVCEHYEARS